MFLYKGHRGLATIYISFLLKSHNLLHSETQVKEHSYLGEDGLFKTDREYPKFVIQEMTVNALLCKHLHKIHYVNNYIMSPSATFLQNVV